MDGRENPVRSPVYYSRIVAHFGLHYAGNIEYYHALNHSDEVVFDLHEHFPKQTFRNRMEILGPNGRQKLIIPTLKTGQRRTMGEVMISYEEHWQKDHWKSLEAAYRRSAYFEFYEDQIRPFYSNRFEFLSQFNIEFHTLICELLGISCEYTFSKEYRDATEIGHDYRGYLSKSNPSYEMVPYIQVFNDRFSFEGNLSILDALFNLGPQAKQYVS